MQATLIVVGGIFDGRILPLKGPEFTVGRDSTCHLRPSSNEVGHQHCAFVLRDERVCLRDGGSSHGTRINGRRLLGGELELKNGDTIKVGPLTFRLSLVVESFAPAASSTETDDDLKP